MTNTADDISYQAVGELCDVARAEGVAAERERWERAIQACAIQFVRPGYGPAQDETIDVVPVAALTALLTQLRAEAGEQ